GTADFTLIRVRKGDADQLQLHRVAVGDHLILGGDNLDLALAHHIEQQVTAGAKIEARQWDRLVASCRQAKETLLGDDAPEQLTINLPASGARLIGGGRQVALSRPEVEQVLLDGFFPHVPLDARPEARQSGFQEFGLPYAADPAITRHLAAFLSAHRHVAIDEVDSVEQSEQSDPARPDVVLLNGGLFASPAIRRRLLDVVTTWFGEGGTRPAWTPTVLVGDRLDLAVARGAAYYGMVRRGEGVRIAADLARSYFMGVDGGAGDQAGGATAVCLVPASTEPGHDIELTGRRFELTLSQPVEFPLYVSSTRLTDQPGDLVPVDREQMTPLAPIRTVLHSRNKRASGAVAVIPHARLSEIGTLELWCSQTDRKRSWRMEFDVRSATQTDRSSHMGMAERQGFLDEATWDVCRRLVEGTFGPQASDPPAKLVRRLIEAIGSGRNEWPASLLRRLWEALIEHAEGRRYSQSHETRWLNLLGFSLRPGYGLAVDDWRVDLTWRTVQGRLIHRSPACVAESWILWRRIGAGLQAGQQQALANPLLGLVRGLHRRLTTGRGRGGDTVLLPQESAEVWRLLGSLELLDVGSKIELGKMMLDLLPKKKMRPVRSAMVWAVGRLAARVPLHGPLNTVLAADVAAEWVERLIELDSPSAIDFLAAMQLTRRTDDRYRDLSDEVRGKVLDWLTLYDASAHLMELVRQGGTLDHEEQVSVFGEALPKGLRVCQLDP
ncbi:MAG: molecular chaperone DnaK, partial [Pirellulales bacterium]